MRKQRGLKVAVAAVLVGVVVLLATQGSAHFRQPSTFRRLKHDLRHLESNGYFSERLFAKTFVEGFGSRVFAEDRRTTNGTTLLVDIPGFARIVLGRNVGGMGGDCYVNFDNQSGEALLRNGILKQSSGSVIGVPASSHPALGSTSSFDAAVTTASERGSFGTYHISSRTNLGTLSFTVAVTQDTDNACYATLDGFFDD